MSGCQPVLDEEQPIAWVIRLVALVGVVDSLWMLRNPAAWGRFWAGVIAVIRQGGRPARVAALSQLSVSLYLLRRGGKRP